MNTTPTPPALDPTKVALDDRGSPLRSLASRTSTRVEGDPDAARLVRRVHSLADMGSLLDRTRLTPRGCLFSLAVLVGSNLCVLGVMWAAGLLGTTRPAFVVPVAFGAIYLLFFALRKWFGPVRPDRTIATLRRHGICAHCGYVLRGLPVAHDSCVECPECGLAWRADLIVAPLWDPPAYSVLSIPRRRLRRNKGRQSSTGPTSDDDGAYAIIPTSWLRLDQGQPPADERRRLVRVLRRHGRIPRLLVAGFPQSLGILALVTFKPPDPADPPIAGIILFSVCTVIAVVVGTSEIALPSDRRAAVLLRQGRCPVCVGPLPGALAESRRCPRCRHAWSLAGLASRRSWDDRVLGFLRGERAREWTPTSPGPSGREPDRGQA